ncbi:MAG: DUF2062 domain-containing protein [Chitinivibrionales bacterium]|nr:DUF2062 domain-containing protein [Chitinivibrionales bacterium]
MSQAPESDKRVAAIIPTCNNATTLEKVLVATQAHIPDVIVINDGSTDATAEILRSIPGIEIMTFERNQGKGSALKAGFLRAREKGFTHAITLDADGQHLAEDLPAFIEKINLAPQTLWIGNRIIPTTGIRQPPRSSFGRKFGAFWYKFHTGLAIRDTQCGFRAYPLELIKDITCKGSRYEYEIELLVKSAWHGIVVKQLDIHLLYQPKHAAVSHFRPIRDFVRISRFNAKASIIKIFLPFKTMPAPGNNWRDKLKFLIKHELRSNTTPRKAALSLALGVFMAIFPIHGFQVVTLMALTFLFNLNRPLAFIGVSVSSPPFLPFLVIFGVGIGQLVLRRTLDFDRQGEITELILRYGIEFIVGSIILAIVAGVATYFLSIPTIRQLKRMRLTRNERRIRKENAPRRSPMHD